MRRSSFEIHTLTCAAHKRERERVVIGEEGGSVFWVLPSIFWGIYIEEAFVGFFPLGFSEDKYLCSFLCGCACLSCSDLLAYGYFVLMLNVLRSDITIKIQHLISQQHCHPRAGHDSARNKE